VKSVEHRLKECILSRYKSIREFSGVLGMPYSTLDTVLKRGVDKAGVSTVRQICRALNLSVDALMDGRIADTSDICGEAGDASAGNNFKIIQGSGATPAALSGHEQGHIKKYRACDRRGKEMVDVVLDYEYHRTNRLSEPPRSRPAMMDVKVYYDAASAGAGNYLSEPSYEIVQFPAGEVPSNTDFGVHIRGDSMEPEIPDGCVAFVQYCPVIESGEIGVFSLDENGYCKKLVVDYDAHAISLVSLNPAYGPIVIHPEATLYTFGRVLGYGYC